MPIDPNIALNIKPLQLANPLEQYGQFQQAQAAMTQNRLADLVLGQRKRETDESAQMNMLYKGALSQDGKLDRNKLLGDAAAAGLGSRIQGIQKGFLEQDKTQADIDAKRRTAEKAQFEVTRDRLGILTNAMSGVKDQASYTQQRSMLAAGGFDMSQVPEQYDPAYVEAAKAQALTYAQRLEQGWKEKGYDLEVQKAGEQTRHNRATEGVAAGQLGVAQGNLKVAQTREAREASAPKGVVVQSDTGPLVVDPRNGHGTPVTVGGKVVPPKGSGQAAKDAQSVIDLLDQADPLLDTATHSLIGAGYDRAAAAFGKSTEGAQASAQLKALEGMLISKQPKMTGPQSDKDVLLYRQMAGQIGDASLPIETRRAALRGVREMAKKTLGQPTAPAEPTKVRKYNPATGKIE